MTNYFLVHHPGHGGGAWLMCCINNHPAGMSVLGELQKDCQLQFERRGLDPRKHLASETRKFFEDRAHYGDVAAGIIKSFWPAVQRWVLAHDGRVIQMVRNPLYHMALKLGRKGPQARKAFRKRYDRDPAGKREEFIAHLIYYIGRKYMPFLSRANKFPIVRLEDLNKSCGGDGSHFKAVLEWLTQTEWPSDYVRHIIENWTPAYRCNHWVEWDDEGRVSGVFTVQQEEMSWPYRDNWGEDPDTAEYWARWEPWQQELYLEHFSEIQQRLGYNQGHIGSCDKKWEHSKTYGWED